MKVGDKMCKTGEYPAFLLEIQVFSENPAFAWKKSVFFSKKSKYLA